MSDLTPFKRHKIVDNETGKTVEYETRCNGALLTAFVSAMFDKDITRIDLLDGLIVISAVSTTTNKAKVKS